MIQPDGLLVTPEAQPAPAHNDVASHRQTTKDFFICHSRKTQDFAASLGRALGRLGLSCYIDREQLSAGEEWRPGLAEAIRDCAAFIMVISPWALESQECLRELRLAVEYKKRIIPLEYVTVPTASAPPALQDINWYPCMEPVPVEQAAQAVKFASGADWAWLKAHARLLQQAEDWHAQGRPRGLLLRSKALREAVSWLDNDQEPSLTELQRQFILASRRNEWLTVGASLAVLVLVLAVPAVIYVRSVTTEEAIGLSRSLAERARELLDRRPDISLRLSAEAETIYSTFESRRALLTSLLRYPQWVGMLPGHPDGGGERQGSCRVRGFSRCASLPAQPG